MREKLLGTKDLRLDKTIEMLKTNQILQFQVASVTQDERAVNINKVRPNTSRWFSKRSKGRDQKSSKSGNRPDQQAPGSTNHKPCKFCGKKHEFKRNICPAADKECHKSKKKGHFATVFQSAKKTTAHTWR